MVALLKTYDAQKFNNEYFAVEVGIDELTNVIQQTRKRKLQIEMGKVHNHFLFIYLK